MFSIFSYYLRLLGVTITDETKVSEQYAQLRIIQSRRNCVLECPRIFVSGDEKLDEDVIYAICTNSRLRNLLEWVNDRIVLAIGITDYRAIDVRIRIFTSTLNKLVDDWYVPDDIAKKIHRNLTSNIRQEMSVINTEDLPF
jgi:hypothetical protein